MFVLNCPVIKAEELNAKAIAGVPGIVDLYLCEEPAMGIQLQCNKRWKQEIEKNAVVFTISEEPVVLLTVSRSKEIITGMDELTREKLKQLGQYADGFQIEPFKIGQDSAVKILGDAAGFPELYVLDVYVLHDYKLYGFLFSVNPKEEGRNYSVLFAKIMESIRFLDKKS
jgi:hypothetical protein